MDNYLKTKNNQREITHIIKELNWSKKKFAGYYCINESERDIEEEYINKFYEKLKKHLKRDTTDPSILDKYIKCLKDADEYNKNNIKEFIPLTGKFQDHCILVEETSKEYKSIIEVATAYALAVGTAWDFNVIPIKSVVNDDEDRFIVIWTGDIGHSGGSGSWGPAMCEVIKNHWGEYYVDTAEHFFDVGLRKITEIVGCIDHQLIFIGKNYDTNDANNYPSLKYKTYLMKNSNLKWDIVKTELIN